MDEDRSAVPSIEDEVRALRAQLAVALARIEDLEGRAIEPPVAVPVPVATDPPPPEDGRIDRRRAMRGAAMAAGAATAALLLGDAKPAAAADGSNLILGSQNQGCTQSTIFAVTGSGGRVGLGVVDNARASYDVTPAVSGHAKGSQFSTALEGKGENLAFGLTIVTAQGTGVEVQSTSGVGVDVYTSTTGVRATSSSLGVWGNASTASGEGVVGTCGGGTGVRGQATNGIGVKGISQTNDAIEGTSTSASGVSGVSTSSSGVYGQSTSGYGIQAFSSGGNGLAASGKERGIVADSSSAAPTAIGVESTSTAGTGVKGTSTSGAGVQGVSNTGFGVQATSFNGTGLSAVGAINGILAQSIASDSSRAAIYATTGAATGVIVDATSGMVMSGVSDTGGGIGVVAPKFHFRMGNADTRGAPTTDAFAHPAGDIVHATSGDTWVCTVAGTPGTWRKLAGPATAGQFHVLPSPVRIYDSRVGTAPSQGPKTKLSGNVARVLDCTHNSSGVPLGATAVSLTVLLIDAFNGNGNLTIWANGAARPSANTAVWGAGSGRYTTTAISAVDASARIQASASAATNLVLDVVGYYR